MVASTMVPSTIHDGSLHDGSLHDGSLHDGSLPQLQSLVLQVGVDLIQKTLPQVVFLQEVAEVEDGGLVGQGA